MLSAPKEGSGSKQENKTVGLFPFESLYGVLDSMQGLDHLIEEVSVDEIAEADQKAKQLIQRLSSLQKSLASLDATKRFLANLETTIVSEAQEHQIDFSKAVPDLAIIRTILLRLTEAGQNKSAAATLRTPVEESSQQPAAAAPGQSKASSPSELVENPAEAKKDISKKSTHVQATKATSNLIPFPGPLKSAKDEGRSAALSPAQSRDRNKEQDSVLEQALALAENHLALENLNEGPSVKDENTTAPDSHNFTLGEKQVGDQKFELGVSFGAAESAESIVIDEHGPIASSQSAEATPKARSHARNKGETAKMDLSFDQDLLNNLIKDYGEFTIYTKLSAEVKKEEAFVPASPKIPPQPVERSAPRVDATPRQQPPARPKKEGDIDKKLKKLVQAYGEVDKYSTGKGESIKRAAIAIIALLIISAVSIFFLKFRVPTSPSPSPAVVTEAPSAPSTELADPSASEATRLHPGQSMKSKTRTSDILFDKELGKKESSNAKDE